MFAYSGGERVYISLLAVWFAFFLHFSVWLVPHSAIAKSVEV